MEPTSNTRYSVSLSLPRRVRLSMLAIAIIGLLGPNGLYLYFSLTQPELNSAAISNPIALAFMIEAIMLVAIFLFWVYQRTRSWKQVATYFVLTMCGSLAFSFPLFLYRNSQDG